ncbi:RagB/SusD family nutrient uptake outer membrane protein [Algibacter lectus]|uniref:Putative outer membrane protein n=1 Tax=Algibacter lectus TaxID=221126 RepID=A0A090WR50_9FLAO|nr:RagB/SusD family nutrient uptake outer membrane protein [Algibacter lectus]MWW24737.1 RagB/SusD family nutrient uptake outer membrane protein [Algibacter lectus]TDY62758.1 putative outer membrane starch-binding protein [Algibacter lectus]GAL62911.1 putative outer membrane protein [Algibacter lectus]GAL79580.1 putative outer membrane protein [Algibacter lectus]
MKKTKYIFLMMIGLGLGLSAVGCSDLEEEPVGLLSPDGFYQTTDDIQLAVNASLTHAINEEIWGRKLSIALLLRSDMVDLASTETRRVEMNTHTISGNNEMVFDPWTRIYLGIAAANDAIAGGEKVEVADEFKNPVIAQAYFARAFYYFHLVRLFGDVPYITEPVTDINASSSLSSTPEAQVYENIISDLQYAEQWLPNTVTSRATPSKAAAKSYLALVYLTLAGTNDNAYFQLAYNKAKEVITNKATYDVDLDPDFQTLFNANKIDASKEPIFALDYNNVEASDNSYDQTAPMTGVRGDDDDQGWSVAVPAMAVYDSFDEDDYRKRVSFQTRATIGGTDVDYTNFTLSGHSNAKNRPYIAKYTRYPGPYARGNKRATSHNYSMIRYAEVLLIAAEAGVEIGAADAVDLLNEVRSRARNGGDSTNGAYVEETIAASTVPADLTSITVADVLEERRIELAFEGKRWYDIKRRQLGDQVFSASGYEGAKPDWNSAEDYDTPIPQDELDRNPNL